MTLQDIERVASEKIRPQLARHGGDIRLLGFEDGVVRFELLGQCAGCPAASLTTEQLIRTALTEELPEVRDAVLVEHVDEDLIAQARAILAHRRP